ncbi:hypothetical protein [Acidocella sp.]|uniref:hypothetical protein n=1 Tax=Acidocella sp. TaxID=50710 RepID=UPI003D065407
MLKSQILPGTAPPVPRMACTATGLAHAAIESPRFAQREDREIWSAGWVCVGTTVELVKTGDILPYTVGDQGIHVARGEGGKLLGRFNMAPHGGCRFVPLQCQTGAKTKCTVTSCGYSRDRGVMNAADELATHQYLGLRPERLVPVPVYTQDRLIFVNLGEQTSLPAPFLAQHALLEHGATHREVWCEYGLNWKELPARLFGGADAQPHGDWLRAEIRCLDETIEIRWMFPNLVLLLAQDSACALVVQPTALRLTMARVTGFGAQKDWHAMLRHLLCNDITPDAPAARFLRTALARRMGPDAPQGGRT